MVGAGMLTGEAFFGSEGAIMSFIDTLGSSPAQFDSAGVMTSAAVPPIVVETFGESWPLVRLTSFILLNAGLAYLIYSLFRKIGVFGNKEITTEA